jgi:hypothetical protein
VHKDVHLAQQRSGVLHPARELSPVVDPQALGEVVEVGLVLVLAEQRSSYHQPSDFGAIGERLGKGL